MGHLTVPFRRGTIFFLDGAVDHLYVVINDPVYSPEDGHEAVCVVNITSVKPGFDSSCILRLGDHPFVRHDSYIYYAGALIRSADKIKAGYARGELRTHAPMAEDVFARILAGFTLSDRTPRKVLRFLSKHAKAI